MKPLYIGATLQDTGKTSTICGLIQALGERGLNPGYMKPVGQRYIEYQGENIDEDAVLFYEVFNLPDAPVLMSPVAIERGFTRKYIFEPNPEPLEKKILKASAQIAEKHPITLVEGTGHAGVGACFSLSNARVAQLLGAKVIIIAPGGIGKPIDEVAVSLALFEKYNVEVIGVILNKVMPDKIHKINETVAKGMANLGTKLLGTIPYEETLSRYTIGQVAEAFNYELICGHGHLGNHINHIVVAAMEPQNVMQYIQKSSIIITPGDRIDNILLTLALSRSTDFHDKLYSGGLILTGGLKPDPTILELLKKSDIPTLTTKEDTFTVSARMKDLAFKIQTFDRDKIAKTLPLVKDNVNIDYILEQLK
jgi:BioD-like phosphotransacetylase family protein